MPPFPFDFFGSVAVAEEEDDEEDEEDDDDDETEGGGSDCTTNFFTFCLLLTLSLSLSTFFSIWYSFISPFCLFEVGLLFPPLEPLLLLFVALLPSDVPELKEASCKPKGKVPLITSRMKLVKRDDEEKEMEEEDDDADRGEDSPAADEEEAVRDDDELPSLCKWTHLEKEKKRKVNK